MDVLIEERAKALKDNPLLWHLIRTAIFPLLQYGEALRMADAIAHLPGRAVFDHLQRRLDLQPKIRGLEHVPRTGRCMIVANHPTGIADGLALYRALQGVREDLVFIANQDALRVAPGLADIVIPVEWVAEKRNLAKTRQMWRLVRNAFAKERCLVMFPSGRVAQLGLGRLVDRPWHAATIAFSQRNEAPIIPLHMAAWNSWIYYLFSKVSAELRDMTLFNELLNKRGMEFRLTFGPAIAPTDLRAEADAEIVRLRNYVERGLPRGLAWNGQGVWGDGTI